MTTNELLVELQRRINQLEATIAGLSQQYQLTLSQKYEYVTREEYRALNQRLTAAVSLNANLINQIQTALDNNTLLTLTEEEMQALKAGAQQVASVQADFKRVLGEIQTEIDEFERILAGEGRSLETRIAALETKVSTQTSQLEILEANYGTILASVNELKRHINASPRIYVQNTTPSGAVIGDFWLNDIGVLQILLSNGTWKVV